MTRRCESFFLQAGQTGVVSQKCLTAMRGGYSIGCTPKARQFNHRFDSIRRSLARRRDIP